MRPGRHSGILIPQFGFNDLVRPNRSYNRQISNIGYYWAPNDYLDLTGRLDWYSNRYVQYGIGGQYNWINRFVDGSVAYSKQDQSGGSSSTTVRWDHRQTFDLSTSLNLDLNYASNTAVIRSQRDRPAAQYPTDHQLAQLFQALWLGHGDAGRQPAPESL